MIKLMYHLLSIYFYINTIQLNSPFSYLSFLNSLFLNINHYSTYFFHDYLEITLPHRFLTSYFFVN